MVTAIRHSRVAGLIASALLTLVMGSGQALAGPCSGPNPAQPTVTSVSPSFGSTAGGASVNITGTNFTDASPPIVFIGGTAATFVTVDITCTIIHATTLAGVPGITNVTVTTPAGTGTGSNLYTYVVGSPTVTGISPTFGLTSVATPIGISGTNFVPGNTQVAAPSTCGPIACAVPCRSDAAVA